MLHTHNIRRAAALADNRVTQYQRIRIMKDTLVLLLSALAFIVILSPVLALYALLLVIQVTVVNPLRHIYRIVRYGIEYDPQTSA